MDKDLPLLSQPSGLCYVKSSTFGMQIPTKRPFSLEMAGLLLNTLKANNFSYDRTLDRFYNQKSKGTVRINPMMCHFLLCSLRDTYDLTYVVDIDAPVCDLIKPSTIETTTVSLVSKDKEDHIEIVSEDIPIQPVVPRGVTDDSVEIITPSYQYLEDKKLNAYVAESIEIVEKTICEITDAPEDCRTIIYYRGHTVIRDRKETFDREKLNKSLMEDYGPFEEGDIRKIEIYHFEKKYPPESDKKIYIESEDPQYNDRIVSVRSDFDEEPIGPIHRGVVQGVIKSTARFFGTIINTREFPHEREFNYTIWGNDEGQTMTNYYSEKSMPILIRSCRSNDNLFYQGGRIFFISADDYYDLKSRRFKIKSVSKFKQVVHECYRHKLIMPYYYKKLANRFSWYQSLTMTCYDLLDEYFAWRYYFNYYYLDQKLSRYRWGRYHSEIVIATNHDKEKRYGLSKEVIEYYNSFRCAKYEIYKIGSPKWYSIEQKLFEYHIDKMEAIREKRKVQRSYLDKDKG